jgi:hypothetical protein
MIKLRDVIRNQLNADAQSKPSRASFASFVKD